MHLGHDSNCVAYFANPKPPSCVPPTDDQARALKPVLRQRSDKISLYSDNDPGAGGICVFAYKSVEKKQR